MSTSTADPKDRARRLLEYLRRFKNDRGAMAYLRCALSSSPAKRARAWPLLAPVGGVDEPRVETVAGLCAWHPDETREGNLGTSCRLLAAENKSFDGRFRRLLTCGRDEICVRVQPVVLAARPKGIRVNYEELFADLCYWSDAVKARWAREFWGAPEGEGKSPSATLEPAP
jgi:CRISPR type I-E-associated protein CasB/Cse2